MTGPGGSAEFMFNVASERTKLTKQANSLSKINQDRLKVKYYDKVYSVIAEEILFANLTREDFFHRKTATNVVSMW